MKSEIVIAFDLGGTNLRMAAVGADGSLLYRAKRETPRAADVSEIIKTIVEAARECQSNCREFDAIALAAAVPATVSVERGLILKAPNLPALDNLKITAALENELNLKTVLENDANAAALGENWLGASRGVKNSILVTLGTGVGGGIVIDGKVLRGIDGTAGEIGHITVEPFGAKCGCGSIGCVEQYASAGAMARIFNELKGECPDSLLQNKPAISGSEIYAAGKAGDELALEIFRRAGFYLGVALSGLVNVLNPEIIVIGGGVAAGWDLLVPHTETEIRKRAFSQPAARAKIVRAELGDDAGIFGAARLAFEI